MDLALITLITLAALGLIGFCLIFILYFSSAFITWPPSIPTDKKSRRKVLELIKSKYPADSKIKIADLGSGYGHFVRDLARQYKNAAITGVELLWLPYLGGKLLCKRFKNIKIIKSDLLNYDLSNEDVIFHFFRVDEALDKKLEKEVKKGGMVINNNFPMSNREADEVIEMKEAFVNRKLYVYYF